MRGYAFLIVAVALGAARSPIALCKPPATQPATTQPAAGGDDELKKQMIELLQRMQALETKHSQEHEADQRRIAELEAKLQALQAGAGAATSTSVPVAGSQPASAPPGAGGEEELEALIAGGGSGAAAGATTRPAARQTGVLGAIQSGIQSMNPDISLNGDFVGVYSKREGGHPDDEFRFRELEMGFSGSIDPYTRADIIATISDEEGDVTTDLEEAYVTYTQLPYNLQARFGKFRAEFGRANAIHLHALPWVDYPFVIRRFFGNEGLSGTGAELSWLIPNPKNEFISLTYEIFNNDNDVIFAGDEHDDFTHLLRLKSSHDFNPETNLEYGTSFATAPNNAAHGGRRAYIEGLDATLRWKPKGEGLYKALLWQNEVFFAESDIIGGRECSNGFYSAIEYQFARRWKFGVRMDQTQLPFSSSHDERGYSAYLTFLQSEFLFWRLAYIHTMRDFKQDGNFDDDQIFLQCNFTLGAHPAHKY